jgi:hypothetical protein
VSLEHSGFLNTIPRAIPVSDTPESVSLRIAAVEAMIAKRLTKYMLRTVFSWSDPLATQPSELEHFLEHLRETRPRTEAIVRVIINSTEPSDIRNRIGSIINPIIQEVTEKCAPLLDLPQRECRSAFQDDLTKFLDDVLQIWKHAQRGELRTVATSTIDEAVDEWGEQDEHQAAEGSISQEPVTVLFPQVYQITTENLTVIHPGFVLWSDHDIYCRGKAEYSIQERRNVEALGRTTSRVSQKEF